MTRWDWYWLAWLALGFGVPETIAMLTNPRNTLSDTVWRWFGVEHGVPIWQWTFLHIVLLAVMIWLTGHFVLRIWS